MPTTTNFGWTTPADTDLVKDGALAIRTLAGGIDTSMVGLKGGTTGQILSKTSATDMAFTWINNDQGDLTAITAGTGISVTSGTGPIPTVAIDTGTTVDKTTAQTLTNKTLTAPIISTISNTGTLTLPTSTDTLVGRATTDTLTNKTISASSNTLTGVINNTLTTTTGDIIYASSANTPARLGIGSAGQVLTVASGIPSWAAASSGKVLQVVQGTKTDTASTTSQTFVTTGLSVSITPSSTSSKILVWVMGSFGLDPNQSNVYAALYRGSTSIIVGDAAGNRPQITTMNYVGNGNFGGGAGIVYLDSPSTTSATTYALYYRSSEGGTVYVNRTSGDNNATTYSPRSASVIVAMEIGA